MKKIKENENLNPLNNKGLNIHKQHRKGLVVNPARSSASLKKI